MTLPDTGRSAPSLRLLAVAYALLAAALLALYWFPEPKLLAGDENHYHNTAMAILAGGDWFDHNLLWPPLQGLFLAGVYAIAGPSILPAQLLQLLMLAGGGLLLADTLDRLGVDRATSRWTSALLCVNPLSVGFATYLWPEIQHLVLSLFLAWCLVRARQAAGRAQLAWSAGAGVALGLCLLSKSLLTGFWPLLLLPLWRRQERARSAGRAVVFLLAALLVTAPALQRGFQLTGKPQIADSSWFNLWVGLQDRWRGDFVFDVTGEHMREYLLSSEDPRERNAFARARALAIVAERGPVATLAGQLGKQYFRLFDARHFVVSQLAGEVCAGYKQHYRGDGILVNRGAAWLLQAWHVGLLVLAAFGIAAWRGWRRPWLWLVLAFVAYQLALFAGLHVKTRFLLPMLPVLCLFAGHWLAHARRPTAAGTALALAFGVLALGGPWLDRACETQAGRSGSVGDGTAAAPAPRSSCTTSLKPDRAA